MRTHQLLIDLEACKAGQAFASQFETLQEAWLACDNIDWMIWLLEHLPNIDQQKLIEFNCRVAERVLPLFEKIYPNDDRPRKAIEAARNIELSQEEKKNAANAAYYAVNDAYHEAYRAAYYAANAAPDKKLEQAKQIADLKELFPNPFKL